MSLDLLGEGFDLHTGGEDLRFPHHENERAQAVAWGRRFANHWMHHGFVVDTSGEKMSKSLGNFTNLLDLVDAVDPRAYRLLVLQAHYRSPLAVDRENIARAETSLRTLDAFARRAETLPDAEPDAPVLAAFCEAMDDDLNTPRAMAVVFDTARRANAAIDAHDPAAPALAAAVRSMCGAVGLELRAVVDDVTDAARAKAAALDEARARKDYGVADQLRAELQAEGWVVETTKTGTTLRRA
jgi:cysteinyl-tRNA synthetase